jgi:hypothetical protein
MKICTLVASATLMALSTGTAFAQSEAEQLRQYCAPDIERLCPGVPVEGGKLKECLHAHEKDMTVGCAEALKKLKG